MAKKRHTPKESPVRAEWKARRRVLTFVGIFLLVMVSLHLLTSTSFFAKAFAPVVHLYAAIAGGFLNLFGSDITVMQESMTSSAFSMSIARGCDALEPMVLWSAGVLAFPVSWKAKWRGLGLGIVVLFTINLVRIITLFIFGLNWPDAFEVMHIQIWQILFIAVTAVLLILWIRWALAKYPPLAHA